MDPEIAAGQKIGVENAMQTLEERSARKSSGEDKPCAVIARRISGLAPSRR